MHGNFFALHISKGRRGRRPLQNPHCTWKCVGDGALDIPFSHSLLCRRDGGNRLQIIYFCALYFVHWLLYDGYRNKDREGEKMRETIIKSIGCGYAISIALLCLHLYRMYRNPEKYDQIPGYERYKHSKFFWPATIPYERFDFAHHSASRSVAD